MIELNPSFQTYLKSTRSVLKREMVPDQGFIYVEIEGSGFNNKKVVARLFCSGQDGWQQEEWSLIRVVFHWGSTVLWVRTDHIEKQETVMEEHLSHL